MECWNEEVKYTNGSVKSSGLWYDADPLHPELELGMSLNIRAEFKKKKEKEKQHKTIHISHLRDKSPFSSSLALSLQHFSFIHFVFHPSTTTKVAKINYQYLSTTKPAIKDSFSSMSTMKTEENDGLRLPQSGCGTKVTHIDSKEEH